MAGSVSAPELRPADVLAAGVLRRCKVWDAWRLGLEFMIQHDWIQWTRLRSMNGDLCDSRLAFTMTSVFAKVSGYQSEGDVWFHSPCPFNHCPVAGCGQQLLAARVAEGLLGATGLFEGGLASLGVVEVDVPSAAAEVRTPSRNWRRLGPPLVR